MAVVAALLAFVLFVLAAFGVDFDSFNIVYAGHACLALAVLFIAWPVGFPGRRG